MDVRTWLRRRGGFASRWEDTGRRRDARGRKAVLVCPAGRLPSCARVGIRNPKPRSRARCARCARVCGAAQRSLSLSVSHLLVLPAQPDRLILRSRARTPGAFRSPSGGWVLRRSGVRAPERASPERQRAKYLVVRNVLPISREHALCGATTSGARHAMTLMSLASGQPPHQSDQYVAGAHSATGGRRRNARRDSHARPRRNDSPALHRVPAAQTASGAIADGRAADTRRRCAAPT